MLQVRRDRREILERFDRLLAPLRVPRAQRGREDLLEQGRLTVGRGPEDAQVAPAYAETRQLGDRADDLLLGVGGEEVGVVALAVGGGVVVGVAGQVRLGWGVVVELVAA